MQSNQFQRLDTTEEVLRHTDKDYFYHACLVIITAPLVTSCECEEVYQPSKASVLKLLYEAPWVKAGQIVLAHREVDIEPEEVVIRVFTSPCS